MKKIILVLTEEEEKRANELFDYEFITDESCSDGSLPASKEWSGFLSAWESRKIEPLVVANAEFKLAVSLLRDLADLQNFGAPLFKYEKEWRRTMDNIYVFLNEHESKKL